MSHSPSRIAVGSTPSTQIVSPPLTVQNPTKSPTVVCPFMFERSTPWPASAAACSMRLVLPVPVWPISRMRRFSTMSSSTFVTRAVNR